MPGQCGIRVKVMPKFCFWNLDLRQAEKILQDTRYPFHHHPHSRSIYIVLRTPKSSKVHKRAEETTWKEKNLVFDKSNVFSHIKACQLQSTCIINYLEAVNKDIICPKELA